MPSYMRHWNQKPLVAINIDTNGPNPEIHDIISLSAILVDGTLKISKEVFPCDMGILPNYPELNEGRLSKKEYSERLRLAFDSYKARELFEVWLNKFSTFTEFGNEKTVQLLSFNFHLKSPFLLKWLGSEFYHFKFDKQVRDLASMAHYLNDRANTRAQEVPYSKQILEWMVSKHGIEFSVRRNCLEECRVMVELYAAMMRGGSVLY